MKYVLFSVYKIVCVTLSITNFGVLLEYLPQIAGKFGT